MQLPTDWWDVLQKEYPRRYGPTGWIQVRVMIPRAIQMGHTWEQILGGTRAYKIYCDDTQITGTEKVQMPKTFYDIRNQGWAEDYAPPPKQQTPMEFKLQVRWEELKLRAQACSFREPYPVESADVYETQLRQFEREHPARKPTDNVVSMLAKKVSV